VYALLDAPSSPPVRALRMTVSAGQRRPPVVRARLAMVLLSSAATSGCAAMGIAPPAFAAQTTVASPATEAAQTSATDYRPFEPTPGPVMDRCSRDLPGWFAMRASLREHGAERRLLEENDNLMRQAWARCEGEVKRAEQREAAKEKASHALEVKAARQNWVDQKDEQRAHDPAWALPVLSAKICSNATERATALDDIRKEKKYSKLGGVVDNSALYASQTAIRDADESDAAVRRAIAEFHKHPISCSQPDVRAIVGCGDQLLRRGAGPDPENPCHADRMQQFLRLDL
jgi:hypothetical protein